MLAHSIAQLLRAYVQQTSRPSGAIDPPIGGLEGRQNALLFVLIFSIPVEVLFNRQGKLRFGSLKRHICHLNDVPVAQHDRLLNYMLQFAHVPGHAYCCKCATTSSPKTGVGRPSCSAHRLAK